MADSDLFTFEIEGLSDELHVISFHGTEGISQLYEFQVDFECANPDIDFESVIGKPGLLTLVANEDDPRYMHGLVARIEITGNEPDHTLYQATIVPAIWTLGLRLDACIYQGNTTPEIIKDVLVSAKLSEGDDFDLRLSSSYPAREYCVQYRETDFAFISRLMEEDGLFYFFEHTDSGHKLVVADTINEYPVITGPSALKFHHAGAGLTAEEAEVRNLRFARTLQTGKVELRSFNFQKTTLDLTKKTKTETEDGFEHYDYAGRYEDASYGSTRAKVRLDAIRAEHQLLAGDSNCRQFMPGHRFTVEEHPRDSINSEYVLLRVSHFGSQSGAFNGEPYGNAFDAMPADVLFRAPQITPDALVDGPQTAMVTGPSGEEIYVDSYGRVKVQFHWDRLGARDDKSSCWVRVSQSHRIADLAIPRIGEEVIVDFIEGDPDQPIITGRVYNGTAVTPYSLPADKTKSTFKTLSSPGGNGFNELRFEDAAGGEEVYLHAQKDWNIEVLNDRTQSIGHDHKHTVGNDETMKVKHDRTRTVDGNEDVTIGKNEKVTVGGNRTESVAKDMTLSVGGEANITVAKATAITVQGALTTSVLKDSTTTVDGNESTTVKGNRTDSVDGTYSKTVTRSAELSYGDKLEMKVAKDAMIEFSGKASEKVAKAKLLEAGDEIILQCGDAKIIMKKNGDISIEGGKISVKGSGDVTLKGSKIAAN